MQILLVSLLSLGLGLGHRQFGRIVVELRGVILLPRRSIGLRLRARRLRGYCCLLLQLLLLLLLVVAASN